MSRARTITAAVALAAAGIAGCGSGDAVDAYDLNATLAVSCGDAVFHFVTTDGTEMLTVSIPGLAARASAAGRLSEAYSYGDPGVEITFRTGTRLDLLACADALDGVPEVATEAQATGGSLTVTAVSDPTRAGDPGQMYVLATLRIERLAFDEMAVGPYEAEDLAVGWLPG